MAKVGTGRRFAGAVINGVAFGAPDSVTGERISTADVTSDQLALFLQSDGFYAIPPGNVTTAARHAQQRTVTLTAADLAGLDVTGYPLAPAPGAGLIIMPSQTYARLALNGAPAIDLSGIRAKWANGTAWSTGDVVSSTNGQGRLALPTVPLDVVGANVANQAFNLKANAALPVTGAIVTAQVTPSTGAGTGYAVNDTGTTGPGGATYRVTTIGASGAVTGLAVVLGGTGYSVAAGVTTAAAGAQAGIGTGLTVDVLTIDVSVNPMTLRVTTLFDVTDL